jgi:hypothetical protein
MNELQPTTVIPVRFQGEGLVIGKLLRLVNKIMRSGTEVYEMDFAGLKNKVGRLVFVVETFVASGAYYSWQQIEQEIDSILDDADRQIAPESTQEGDTV